MLSKDEVLARLADAVGQRRQEIVDFLRRLVMTPSVSCNEREVAELIARTMETCRFDKVTVDRLGSVIGLIEGSERTTELLLNGHMDHVPPGDMQDPYSAELLDGNRFGVDGQVLYGRGACDMKAALAAQIMAAYSVREIGAPLKTGLVVTCVVLEDATPGHVAVRHMMEEEGLTAKVAVSGEATNMNIALGHRGGALLHATANGKSCHASAPERGVNAIYSQVAFVQDVQNLSANLPEHPSLGKTSIAVTNLAVSPGALNVIPDKCVAFIDMRFPPNYAPEKLVQRLRQAASARKEKDPQFDVEVELMVKEVTSYTGVTRATQCVTLPFYTDPNSDTIRRARAVIAKGARYEPELTKWTFGTDGAYFASRGIPTFGVGPGEERFAHTTAEHVRIDDVLRATTVYSALACEFCGIDAGL